MSEQLQNQNHEQIAQNEQIEQTLPPLETGIGTTTMHAREIGPDPAPRSVFRRAKDFLLRNRVVDAPEGQPVYDDTNGYWVENANDYNARLDAEHPGNTITKPLDPEGTTTITHRKIYADPGVGVIHRNGPPPSMS